MNLDDSVASQSLNLPRGVSAILIICKHTSIMASANVESVRRFTPKAG